MSHAESTAIAGTEDGASTHKKDTLTSTAMAEGFSGEDPIFAVIQDPSAYLDALHARKDRNARWVRGLSYEDEVNELYTEYVRNQMRGGEATTAMGYAYAQATAQRWLRYPLYCFIVYIMLQFQSYQDSFRSQYRREFPINELQLTRSGRLSGENFFAFFTRVMFPLCVPSLSISIGTFMLAWTIGTSTHHFIALCGIGLAALSWLAAFAQVLTLWAACDMSNVSDRWECDIPFLFYWLCSVIRVGCPLLSLWAVAPVLDLARRAGYRWRLVLSLPALSFAAAVVTKIAVEQNDAFHTPLTLCYFLSMAALACLTLTCWRQEPVEVVVRPLKLHAD